MPAQLLGLTDGIRILVDKPILLLGRDAECDIQFESPKVSRRHCCIAQVGEQLVIRDLCSTNGIRINGVRVVEGYLKAGDELAIGNHRYQVRWDALLPASQRQNVHKRQDGKRIPAPSRSVKDEELEDADEPIALESRAAGARDPIPAPPQKDDGDAHRPPDAPKRRTDPAANAKLPPREEAARPADRPHLPVTATEPIPGPAHQPEMIIPLPPESDSPAEHVPSIPAPPPADPELLPDQIGLVPASVDNISISPRKLPGSR